MQHDCVRLVGNRTERVAFGTAGIAQQSQRLIAVAGKNDLVVALHPAAMQLNIDSGRSAAHRLDAGIDANRVVKTRTSLDDAPLRPVVDAEQAVIAKETREKQ